MLTVQIKITSAYRTSQRHYNLIWIFLSHFTILHRLYKILYSLENSTEEYCKFIYEQQWNFNL